MSPRRPLLMLLLATMLGGCGTITPAPGDQYFPMRVWGAEGAEVLIRGGCATRSAPNPDVDRGRVAFDPPPPCLELTVGPADAEAWIFEARQRVVVALVPYGREPVDHFILGPRQECERIRKAYRYKPSPFSTWEIPPTEPCKGPYYLRLVPPAGIAK